LFGLDEEFIQKLADEDLADRQHLYCRDRLKGVLRFPLLSEQVIVMTRKSKAAANVAVPTVRVSSAFAGFVYFGSLLFEAAQRFYEARMERAQMRLTPTRHLND
jgi:hypothetical protein